MKAVICEAIGKPVRVVERETPEPGAGEVLIGVEACGLNYVDALICRGGYQLQPKMPYTPGSEFAGTVLGVGADVEKLAPGDRVLGRGGYVSHAVKPAAQLRQVPATMSVAQAATFIQSYSTMHYAFERAGLSEGETVLVLGASGGIGRAAVDLARARGARVIAAASSDERLEACRAAGVDAAVNYTNEDLKTRARELSDGGVDVVVDPVGGDLAEPALRALGYLGRYLVIGFAAGAIPKIPINQVLLRNRSVVGIDWGAWSGAHPDEQDAIVERLLAMIEAGEITPQEPSSYPFEQAQQALDDLFERRVIGKAVLTP
ncbi:MAG: NADPH:quinone oxidoreductase family protein [Gammaproteobacteria bacterium]|jgi:NADPH2:quinone reductase